MPRLAMRTPHHGRQDLPRVADRLEGGKYQTKSFLTQCRSSISSHETDTVGEPTSKF